MECSRRETTSRNAAIKGDILTAAITAECRCIHSTVHVVQVHTRIPVLNSTPTICSLPKLFLLLAYSSSFQLFSKFHASSLLLHSSFSFLFLSFTSFLHIPSFSCRFLFFFLLFFSLTFLFLLPSLFWCSFLSFLIISFLPLPSFLPLILPFFRLSTSILYPPYFLLYKLKNIDEILQPYIGFFIYTKSHKVMVYPAV